MNETKTLLDLNTYRILLGSDRGGSITVGVVDQSIEWLIHPLPEHHSGNCPKEETAMKPQWNNRMQ